MSYSARTILALLCLGAALSCTGGCDYFSSDDGPLGGAPTKKPERRRTSPDAAGDAAPPPVAEAAPQSTTGWSFDLAPQAKADGAYALWLPGVGNRPSVLQIASYEDRARDRPPSFMIRATASDATPAALVGKTLPAEVFVQLAADGPVWNNVGGAPAQLTIVAVGGGRLTGRLSGSLVGEDPAAPQTFAGEFNGVLR